MPYGVLVFGLVYGSLAALNSIGFVLLWRTSRVVNLAQPSLGLVGGVLTGMLVASAGWGFWWSAPIGIVLGALLSIGAERFVLARLRDVPRSILLIATVGLAQVFASMYSAIPFMFGGRLPTYTLDLGVPTWDTGTFQIGGAHYLALASLVVVAIGVSLFLSRSRLGVAALSLGQDAERARALGVPASLVRTVVWGIAGAISSIAGILSIPLLGFGLEGGALTPTVLLLALAPAVFAGLRSIAGAAVAGLALGVVYQAAIWRLNTEGLLSLKGGDHAVIVLAAAVLLAVVVQRARIGREEAATRTSSWEAAATQRPIPWRLAGSTPVFVGGLVLSVVAIFAAALPPYLLSPSLVVSYGTAAAFGLGAMAIATAWMFAGELPLGHWGFAGIGAAIAVASPGPWWARAAIGGVAVGAMNLLLARATQRRSSLAFAVVGLAAAAIAPVVARSGAIEADTRTAAAATGVLTVVAAIALIKLRASRWGVRAVAARDDPQRAPWLGVNPHRGRMIGLALSGVMAGIAGPLFVASSGPAGIAPGAFDPNESLRLLAIAVVGGLGSPAGVLLGAIAMTAAQRVLPAPWNGLTSGVGVVAVVMFIPAGIARALERVRDAVLGIVSRAAPAPAPPVVAPSEEVPA